MSTYSRRRVFKPVQKDEFQSAVPVEEVNTKTNSNRLLAGYMAHEVITQGTLFGQQWDPARAEATPVSVKDTKKAKKRARAEPLPVNLKCYREVASLLKGQGAAQLPGVVNPSQLVCWLQN